MNSPTEACFHLQIIYNPLSPSYFFPHSLSLSPSFRDTSSPIFPAASLRPESQAAIAGNPV